MLAGIEVSFWSKGTGRNHRWTDRRGSQNSYLDMQRIGSMHFSFNRLSNNHSNVQLCSYETTVWPAEGKWVIFKVG